MNSYIFEEDLSGMTYHELLRYCSRNAAFVLVSVTMEQLVDHNCRTILNAFLDLGGTSQRLARWPGTILCAGKKATVFTVPISDSLLQMLIDQCPSIFSWRLPSYPEDLSFIRANGRVLICTTTHEQYGILHLNDSEMAEWNRNTFLCKVKLHDFVESNEMAFSHRLPVAIASESASSQQCSDNDR